MEIKRLKELYSQNVNIMKTLRDEANSSTNDLSAILKAYDLQSGSYRNSYYNSHSTNRYLGTEKVALTGIEYNQLRCKKIAEVFNQLKYSSVLEVGVGEATTLNDVIKNLDNTNIHIHGIDISYSRIAYGKLFLKENGVEKASLCVGDMFQLPYKTDSFDIVYTYHCIEPNTDRAKEAIHELYRVAKKYIVLIEPSYELGNGETKRNIENHGYCKDLLGSIKELGYTILEHRLFEVGTFSNQSAIFVIEKENSTNKLEIENSDPSITYGCPKCKSTLLEHNGQYYCEEDSLIYPIISGIPCLTIDSGILATKFLDPLLNKELWDNK